MNSWNTFGHQYRVLINTGFLLNSDQSTRIFLSTMTAWKVSVFGAFLVLIFPHLDWIRRGTPYPLRMRENTDQKNGHFLCSVCFLTHFIPMFHFFPLQRPEKFWFSDVFRGCRNGILNWIRVNGISNKSFSTIFSPQVWHQIKILSTLKVLWPLG